MFYTCGHNKKRKNIYIKPSFVTFLQLTTLFSLLQIFYFSVFVVLFLKGFLLQSSSKFNFRNTFRSHNSFPLVFELPIVLYSTFAGRFVYFSFLFSFFIYYQLSSIYYSANKHLLICSVIFLKILKIFNVTYNFYLQLLLI